MGGITWPTSLRSAGETDGIDPAVDRLPHFPQDRLSQEGHISTSIFLRTAGLLILSNIFMTFAWYAHLRNLMDRPWYLAALASWGIASS